MRTTVTLDPDTEQLVRARMKATGASFKRALNDAIRDGAAGVRAPQRFTTASVSMGVPSVNLDRAIALAGELEDEELLRRMRKGS